MALCFISCAIFFFRDRICFEEESLEEQTYKHGERKSNTKINDDNDESPKRRRGRDRDIKTRNIDMFHASTDCANTLKALIKEIQAATDPESIEGSFAAVQNGVAALGGTIRETVVC